MEKPLGIKMASALSIVDNNQTIQEMAHGFGRVGLCNEKEFQLMLVQERKRSERSLTPFILVKIDIAELLEYGFAKYPLKQIVTAVTSSSRDIDIRGWYKNNHTIGIIYLGADATKKESIIERIRYHFSCTISADIAQSLSISSLIFPDEILPSIRENEFAHTTLYLETEAQSSASAQAASFARRTFDIIGSFAGLFLFAPFFLIIPIFIKLDSKGPVFFRQQRVGKAGKTFTFLKFRSMRANNDETIHKEFVKSFITNSCKDASLREQGVYKIKNDPRVTAVGRFLRTTSLDELPQLFNVLVGDMSIVGPRPCIPYELENYSMWHLRRVLETKPGITGMWQVAGRSQTSFETMVRMDIRYILTRSMVLDLTLIFRTFFSVLRAKGAY